MFDIMCMQYAKKKIHEKKYIYFSLFMDMENHTGTGQDRPDKLKIVPLFNVLIQIKMTKKVWRWIDDVLTHKMHC